jgi:hypothetical protein
MKAVSSVITKTAAAITIPLAASTVVRRGMLASVVRIDPVEYSEVTISAPMTPTTNWERNTPVWENRTGSNWARSAGPRPAQRPASMLETSAERPMPATTTTARAIQVDRTDRSLVHSERMTCRIPARPVPVGGRGRVTVVMRAPRRWCGERLRGSRPRPR